MTNYLVSKIFFWWVIHSQTMIKTIPDLWGVHPIFYSFLVVWLNVGNPGQTICLCSLVASINQFPFCTILPEETSHGLPLCSQVFFVCIVLFFPSFPSPCFAFCIIMFFFWVALLTEISGTCAITPKLTSRVFLKDVILAFQSPLGWIVSQHTPLTYHPQKQWFNKALLSETN